MKKENTIITGLLLMAIILAIVLVPISDTRYGLSCNGKHKSRYSLVLGQKDSFYKLYHSAEYAEINNVPPVIKCSKAEIYSAKLFVL